MDTINPFGTTKGKMDENNGRLHTYSIIGHTMVETAQAAFVCIYVGDGCV